MPHVPGGLTVRADDLTDPRVRELVALHVGAMRADSPPGTSFAPAVALYRRAGFVDRGPFGSYVAGPDNQFPELRLS